MTKYDIDADGENGIRYYEAGDVVVFGGRTLLCLIDPPEQPALCHHCVVPTFVKMAPHCPIGSGCVSTHFEAYTPENVVRLARFLVSGK